MFYYSPSHIFQKKKTKIKFFLKDLPFLFCSILFHSRKAFLRTNTCFIRFIAEYLSLSYKNSSVFWKWISLDFLWFFLTQVFSSFFRHFLFLFITFRFHLFFHFLLCLIFDFSSSPFFLNSVFLNSNFPSFWKKKLFNFSFISCMRYLCMFFCSWICSSVVFFFLFVFSRFYHICFPFPFVFSLHNLSQRQVCGTVAKQKKLVCLIPFLLVTFFTFFCLYMFFPQFPFFVLFSCVFEHFSFWVLVLECLFLCRSLFMCLFFWRPCLVWWSFFFPFFFLSFHILSLFTRMFNGDFQSESIACVVDTSHSARQADMDDMGMKRSAASKRDKTSKAKQRWILNQILLSLSSL